MIDYQNLPSNAKVDWFMQPTSGSEVHTWTKPAGCNFVYMVGVGGGSGGQGGLANITTGSGSAGGNSGVISTLLVPSFLIPDTLFIKVGNGTPGGVISGGLSTAANPTIISAYRVASATEYLLFATGATRSGPGVSPASPITNSTLGSIGIYKSFAGVQGNSTGNQTLTNYLSGGAAGGSNNSGIERVGFSILSNINQPSTITIVQAGLAGGGKGGDGIQLGGKRFAFSGGAGGGSSITAQGGGGGDGELGCGGGGGAPGVTGGAGGKGGDGFALIISY